MNIVLVCVHNFQPYLLTNIKQLTRLGEDSIYVLTHASFFPYFEGLSVRLIDVDTLEETFHYREKSTLDIATRNGFWVCASLRFFYIYSFMNQYNLTNVVHLENDVLTYYNTNELSPFLKEKLYLPFDSYQRNIASIMYIPNASLFKEVLDHYDYSKNDMDNFCRIRDKTQLIENFPIFIPIPSLNAEQRSVCNPSIPFVFDAAAIGQYLGGVDPRNIPGDTRGFINETCVIQYKGLILFDKKPYLLVEDTLYPVFNLHIHSKQLEQFV
jgi:hypothetical protein